MRPATFILLSIPLLAQCAPLVNRAGSVQPTNSSEISPSSSSVAQSTSTSETAFTSTSVSSVSQTPSPSVTSSSVVSALDASETPQPEIVTSPDGAESVFIASSSTNDSTQGVPLIMGYYTSWNSQILEPEEIDFAIYRCVTYAFATLNEALQLSVDSPDLLERLVNAAHAKGTCVILSIGGWDDSAYFSSAVSTTSNRNSFVQQVVELFQNYKLDGFDFDWEYPGQEGKPGNQFNNNDTQNFFAFFQLLRYELPNATISAAALDTPFVGSDGQPMQDVSPFGEVLDWLTIMNYDVVQSSSTPGPDAPLSDYCHNSTQPQASAAAGVDQWTRAGFPVGKLVLGVPYYGYVSNSNASTLRSRASSPSVRLQGDTDGCMLFRDFVSQGALACNTEECYGSGGFARYWDQCSSTPYLRSEAAKQVVSFDDPESMSMKAQFAKKTGMLGVIAWEIAGDTDKGDLGLAIEHGFSVA